MAISRVRREKRSQGRDANTHTDSVNNQYGPNTICRLLESDAQNPKTLKGEFRGTRNGGGVAGVMYSRLLAHPSA